MTRKRTRESLERVLCETCPTCQGRGMVKTAETLCYEIFREICVSHVLMRHRAFSLLRRRRWLIVLWMRISQRGGSGAIHQQNHPIPG